MARPRQTVAIITPHLAASNTGNWHTAARWARLLRPRYRVLVLERWRGEPADALIALHARRSAASIADWAARRPGAPLIVVLTGTDLYRDIGADADALRSLQLATRLVVLNEIGRRALPARLRRKAHVVLQSAPALRPGRPAARHFDVAVVGHLRAEKDPMTVLLAAQHLPRGSTIRIRHAGRALDDALAEAAGAMTRTSPHYRWLGELTRAAARQLVRHARLLLHPSRMEGGAQAVIEAVRAGTPVIASRIDGNVGLLGAAYPGYYPAGDARRCANLLQRAQSDSRFLAALTAACKKRAPLFDPRRERAALRKLVEKELAHNRPPSRPRKPSR